MATLAEKVIPLNPTTQPVEFNITDAAIAELADKYSGMKADTPDNYKAISAAIRDVVSNRTAIEKRRKELKADALAWGKKVDTEAKRITAALTKIEEPLKATKKAVDDEKARIKAEEERKERERKTAIEVAIADINQMPANAYGKPADDIRDLLTQAKAVMIDRDTFGEYIKLAESAKSKAVDAITQLLADREQYDQQQAELKAQREEMARQQEELRKVQAERDAAEAKQQKLAEEKAAAERAGQEAELAKPHEIPTERTLGTDAGINQSPIVERECVTHPQDEPKPQNELAEGIETLANTPAPQREEPHAIQLLESTLAALFEIPNVKLNTVDGYDSTHQLAAAIDAFFTEGE